MADRTSTSPGRVLVVGDVMTDIICKPEGPLVVGSDRRATIRSRPGGSGANQAVWLAAFGLDVRFAARVGRADRSAFGVQFSRLGIDPALAADNDLPSGVLVTIVSPDGERSFLTDRGANAALSPEDLPFDLLDGVRMLVVSGYCLFEAGPRGAAMGLVAEARRRAIPVAVDPASVGFLEEFGAGNFLAWTAAATIIFANEAEAVALSGQTEPDAQVKALGQHYPRVVVKRGATGAALGGRDGVATSLPAPEVKVIDSTGAGDAFAAGFIAAELTGAEPEECLRRGIEAGSDAVTRLGGQPSGTIVPA